MDQSGDAREVEEKLKRVACRIIEHAAKMAEEAPGCTKVTFPTLVQHQ